MEALRRIYGYRMFPGRGPYARAFRNWLLAEAEQARSNDDLARRFIARCRETMTILPAITTIERLCADALVAAERRIEKRIAADRKSTRLNSSHQCASRMPSSACKKKSYYYQLWGSHHYIVTLHTLIYPSHIHTHSDIQMTTSDQK